MNLLFLEALGAMVLLLLIVWWTMFSGRNKGELPEVAASPVQDATDEKTEASKSSGNAAPGGGA